MHAPRSDSESVNTWTSSVRPDLEEPEHFGRTNGMGTWYCTVCTRSPALAHLFSFDPAGAETHERSAVHRHNLDALGRSWLLGDMPADEAAWAIAEHTPYADLRARDAAADDVYAGASVRRRVRAWRRACVLAYGGSPLDEEEEEEEEEREEQDREWYEGEDESELPESVAVTTETTTQELHAAAGPLLAAVTAAPQLVIDDSDSSDSDSSSSSCSTDVIAKCNRLATGTSGSTGRSSAPQVLPSALVTFKAKTVRTGLSKLAAVRNSLRWLGWPAQKSLERVSRLVGRVRH